MYIDFNATEPFDYTNLEQLEMAAHVCVQNAWRWGKLLETTRTEHKADMIHTALLALFKHRTNSRLRALAEAKYELQDYIRVNIWGLNAKDWQPAIGWHVHPIDDLVPEEPNDGHKADVLVRQVYSRYTENELIEEENEVEWEQFRQRVERTFLTILAGMNGKTYGEDLLKAAKVLSYSAMGYTIEDIAETLSLARAEVINLLGKRRKTLSDYLNLPPMMQTLVQTKGATDYYEANELTEETLNSHRTTHLKLSTGVYQLQTYTRRDRPNSPRCTNLVKHHFVKGKAKTLRAYLGQTGRVTYEGVRQAELQLCQKAAELYA